MKEGALVPLHNVLMTIESTDEELFWLPGLLETLLLKVWYPTTVATIGHTIRDYQSYLEQTADGLDKLSYASRFWL